MSGSMDIIYYTYRTVDCRYCSFKHVEYHDFVDSCARVTNRFAQYVHNLCKHMTVTDVDEHTGLRWDQVKRIDKKELKKHNSKRPKENFSILCIDEISMKRRHKYLTVIADHKSGRVLDVLKSQTYNVVSLFLQSLSESIRKNIKAVAMDMWTPYIKAFKKHCPQALIVFDHFHIVAAFSKVI